MDNRDDFHGNPWHPFVRLLKRYGANLPPEHRSAPIAVPGPEGGSRLLWRSLFRKDPRLGRLVPAHELTREEVAALAQWLGLQGEEQTAFLELGLGFLTQRDTLRKLRARGTRRRDEESGESGGSFPRQQHPRRAASPLRECSPALLDGMEASSSLLPLTECRTTSECLRLLCNRLQVDWEILAKAVSRHVGELDSRTIFLQLRGTLPVLSDPVLETALALLAAPDEVATLARSLNKSARQANSARRS